MTPTRIVAQFHDTKPDPTPESDVPLIGDAAFVTVLCANCERRGHVIETRCEEATEFQVPLVCTECEKEIATPERDEMSEELINARLCLNLLLLDFSDPIPALPIPTKTMIENAREHIDGLLEENGGIPNCNRNSNCDHNSDSNCNCNSNRNRGGAP